jgi:phenylalanyl-tRNA synthetase alpha chain
VSDDQIREIKNIAFPSGTVTLDTEQLDKIQDATNTISRLTDEQMGRIRDIVATIGETSSEQIQTITVKIIDGLKELPSLQYKQIFQQTEAIEKAMQPLLDQHSRAIHDAMQPLMEKQSLLIAEALAEPIAKWNHEIVNLLGRIPLLPPDQKFAIGNHVNQFRRDLEAAFAEREATIRAHELGRSLEEGAIDVTLPGRPTAMGRLHPVTQTLREIYAIWAEMGFQIYRSREVEDDDTNFGLLNMPEHHPARDMWDTFYTTTPGVILRTHTSPGQIHAMHAYVPEPIRVILPGMVYRYEQISVRSEIQFHQVEGLAVGHGIRMTDLKGTIAAFARRLYGADRQVRYRASHFPFTEPSMEVDVECILCDGNGCSVCKYTGWLEIAGCGMVHPVVLKNGGYDPAEFSGFAFGFGVERMVMLKHGIADIRYFWGDDLRFLEQF